MARKKTSKPTKPAAPRGHGDIKQTVEQMNDDQLAALTFAHKRSYESALATKKKADARFKNVCKIAKAELGDGAIADIKDLIALDEEGGEKKLSETVQRVMRVARWAGAAIQLDMFKSAEKGAAFAAGEVVGRKGDPAKPPSQYVPGTPEYNEWLAGHRKGNDDLGRATFKADKPSSSEPKDGGDGARPQMTREEWKADRARQDDIADRIIKGKPPIGDAPSTAQVSTTAPAH